MRTADILNSSPYIFQKEQGNLFFLIGKLLDSLLLDLNCFLRRDIMRL